MEPSAAIPELDWNVVDESELMMSQLLGGACQYQEASAGIELMIHPPPDHDACSSDWMYNLAPSFHFPTTDIASTSSFHFSSCELTGPDVMPTMESSSESMDIWHTQMQMVASTLPVGPSNQFDSRGSIGIAEHTPVPKRKVVESGIDSEDEVLTDNPKKKARASTQVQRSAKNERSKKKTLKSVAKEESDASYSSEDNSHTCQEPNGNGDGTSSNAKGKTRASRGSATDSQSLYAKKRRERINERLRTLQNLVPNGTKVDISTMLEEAVQYVKFLQLQIKLLSSDDTWMYAPLAYNGMDLGLSI